MSTEVILRSTSINAISSGTDWNHGLFVSWRGPISGGKRSAGGVATAVDTLHRKCPGVKCLFMDGANLMLLNGGGEDPIQVNRERTFDLQLINDHSTFCGELTWPVSHDMSSEAVLPEEAEDHWQAYLRVSELLAGFIQPYLPENGPILINDYQLVLCLEHLKTDQPIWFYWHTPWPKRVPKEYRPYFVRIATAMLRARAIGCYTGRYPGPFLHFVEDYLPNHFVVDHATLSVRDTRQEGHITRLLPMPVGPNYGGWREWGNPPADRQRTVAEILGLPWLAGVRIVLKSDRLDYTKNWLRTMSAIGWFFRLYPEQFGKVSFVLICPNSRKGIRAFDEYALKVTAACAKTLASCKALAAEKGLDLDDWQPFVLVDKVLKPEDLARIYHDSAGMIVNSEIDGFQLGAVEFVAASPNQLPKAGSPDDAVPGFLALSEGPGVWDSLYDAGALHLVGTDQKRMAHAIQSGLNLTPADLRARMLRLQGATRPLRFTNWLPRFSEAAAANGGIHE